jgi:hypothetical protein
VKNAVQRFRRTFRLEASLFADFRAYGTRRRQMWQKCTEILDDSDATTIRSSVLRNVGMVTENNRHMNGRQKFRYTIYSRPTLCAVRTEDVLRCVDW